MEGVLKDQGVFRTSAKPPGGLQIEVRASLGAVLGGAQGKGEKGPDPQPFQSLPSLVDLAGGGYAAGNAQLAQPLQQRAYSRFERDLFPVFPVSYGLHGLGKLLGCGREMVGANQVVDGLRGTHGPQGVGQVGSRYAAKLAYQLLGQAVPDVHGVGEGAVQIKNSCLGQKVGHTCASKNKIAPGISTRETIPRRAHIIISLRWHYPNQVTGRSAQLPLSPFASSLFDCSGPPVCDPLENIIAREKKIASFFLLGYAKGEQTPAWEREKEAAI